MFDSSTYILPRWNRQRRPVVSFAWIGLFVSGIWLFAYLAKGHACRTGCTRAPLPLPPAETLLEKLAEYYGDNRCHSDIKAGNDLIDAVWSGKEDVVRDLLNRGIDVNSRYVEICRYGETALMSACFDGNVKLVMLL